MKACQYCQKEVKDDAFKCKHCGGWFTNDAEARQKELDNEQRMEKMLQGSQKDKAGEYFSEDTEYFSVSTKKMVLMSILTAGLYELYWFYKNWKVVKIQEEKKLSPFWRAIFCVIFCYSLFKRIMLSAIQKGYKTKNTHGSLAAGYIFLVIISSRAPSPFDLIGILSFVPIIAVNNAIRFSNLKINPQYVESAKLVRAEILFLVLGAIIWVLVVPGILYPPF